MNKKIWYIYKHTNKINGMCYIGKTSKMTKRRYGKDGYGYKNNPVFWSAIQEYGWDNFEHEILFEVEDDFEACEKEKEMILEYNSFENGYNMTKGGAGTVGYVFEKEIVKEISDKNSVKIAQLSKSGEIIKIWDSSRQIKKEIGLDNSHILRCCNNKTIYAYSFIWMYNSEYELMSKEEIEKIANNKMDDFKKLKEKTRFEKSVPIVQLSTEMEVTKIWESGKVASKFGFNQTDIYLCCKGKYHTHRWFKWMRLCDYNKTY